eukprot:UN14071
MEISLTYSLVSLHGKILGKSKTTPQAVYVFRVLTEFCFFSSL